jgi:hypothetical protein
MVYQPFEKHLGYGVQISYGSKPDFLTCLSPQDWKDGSEVIQA